MNCNLYILEMYVNTSIYKICGMIIYVCKKNLLYPMPTFESPPPPPTISSITVRVPRQLWSRLFSRNVAVREKFVAVNSREVAANGQSRLKCGLKFLWVQITNTLAPVMPRIKSALSAQKFLHFFLALFSKLFVHDNFLSRTVKNY